MRARCHLALVTAAALAAACRFDGSYDGTHLRCSAADPRCPDGFTCVADVCTEPGDATDATDAAGPDASVCELAAQAPDNDRCAAALDVTTAARAAGGTMVYGDTTGYAADLAPSTLPGCTGSVEPGPDAIYKLTLQAGDQVALSLAPVAHDGAVYVLDGCSLTASCKGGADALGAGAIDAASVPIAAAGTYYVVVDASLMAAAGCYALSVAITR